MMGNKFRNLFSSLTIHYSLFIIFKRVIESHISASGSDRTHMDRPVSVENHNRVIFNKRTGKV